MNDIKNTRMSDKEFFATVKRIFNEISYKTREGDSGRQYHGLVKFLRDITSPRSSEYDFKFQFMKDNAITKARTSITKMNANVFSSRMHEYFVASGEWDSADVDEEPESIKSIDNGEYVEFYEYGNFYSEKKKLLISFAYDGYEKMYSLCFFSMDENSTSQSLISDFEKEVLEPSPYKGKIIKIDNNGIETVDSVYEEISPYSDEVERSIQWLTSVADEEILQKLKEADLPGHAGVLLEGSPGSGKTTLARRVIREQNEKGVTVFIYGGGLEISEVFSFAEDMLPALIVLEDVESIFKSRGNTDFSSFLNALDGVKARHGLMVLATTNNSNMDKAIVRPGRLEERVVIDGVNPNAYNSLVKSRLSTKTDKEIDEIVQAINERVSAKDDNSVITPAIMDSISRKAIMLSMSQSEIINFIHTEWNNSVEGKDYT